MLSGAYKVTYFIRCFFFPSNNNTRARYPYFMRLVSPHDVLSRSRSTRGHNKFISPLAPATMESQTNCPYYYITCSSSTYYIVSIYARICVCVCVNMNVFVYILYILCVCMWLSKPHEHISRTLLLCIVKIT